MSGCLSIPCNGWAVDVGAANGVRDTVGCVVGGVAGDAVGDSSTRVHAGTRAVASIAEHNVAAHILGALASLVSRLERARCPAGEKAERGLTSLCSFGYLCAMSQSSYSSISPTGTPYGLSSQLCGGIGQPCPPSRLNSADFPNIQQNISAQSYESWNWVRNVGVLGPATLVIPKSAVAMSKPGSWTQFLFGGTVRQ